MKRENIYIVKELHHTFCNLKSLKNMIRNRLFGIRTKTWFADEYSKISFYEFDTKTREDLCKLISDYCDRRMKEIDKELEEL